MKFRATSLSFLVFSAGCSITQHPTIETQGYRQVAIPHGCYEHVGERDSNIAIESNLEIQLLSHLKNPELGVQRCWYERSNGNLLVSFGDECGPHKVASFHLLEGKWQLYEQKEMAVVLCGEKK